MLKRIKILVLFIFLTSSLFCQNIKDLTILHWNDFHANNVPYKTDKKFYPEIKDSVIYIGGSAYLAAYIEKYKSLDKNVLLLNAGDDFQGSPVSTITKGKSQIELMNMLQPDAMTLGNHEFDYSADTLFKFLKNAKYNVISANLLDKKTNKPFFKPYKIFNLNGIKVALIGLMTPELPTLSFPDNIKNITVGNIFQISRKYITELNKKEKPDLFVLLSHCGIEFDIMLADSLPDVDVIIGGHSHTILKQPIKRNKTIICQAGDKGKFLGRINIKVDIDGDSIYNFKSELVSIINSQIEPDKKVLKKVNEYEEIANKGLGEVIGYLESDWVRNPQGESNIGNWQTDVIKQYTNSDIAFQNSGGIRKNLSSGNITIRDIWEINPFGNQFVVFSVKGDILKQMLEYQVNAEEFLQVSGLKLKYNPAKSAGERIILLLINGQPLDPAKTYQIGTNNYVATQGKKYFGYEIPAKTIRKTEMIDKDIFIEAVKAQKRIKSVIENRIEKVNN